MPTYAVRFAGSAAKEFKKLDKTVATRIGKALVVLSKNPRKGSVRPMVGVSSWRLRVGDYRVVYDIADAELVVLVIRVRHRKNAYK